MEGGGAKSASLSHQKPTAMISSANHRAEARPQQLTNNKPGDLVGGASGDIIHQLTIFMKVFFYSVPLGFFRSGLRKPEYGIQNLESKNLYQVQPRDKPVKTRVHSQESRL